MKKGYKRIIALVLSALLLIGTIPVLAADTLPVVVVDPTGETTEGYECYTTMTEAINALGGKAGKVYVKGTLSAAGTALEGTIADREPVIVAGFGDSATGGTITINTEYVTGGDWLKGDMTFENITLQSATAPTNSDLAEKFGFASGGHHLTFGNGIVSGTNLSVGANLNATTDQTITINSGTYQRVMALSTNNTDFGKTANFNSTININGGTITHLAAGFSYAGNGKTPYYNVLNGDYTVNFNGGEITFIATVTTTNKSDVVVLGDTIYNLNGGNLGGRVAIGWTKYSTNTVGTYTDYVAPTNRGNVAVIVDASSVTTGYGDGGIISYINGDCDPENFQLGEGKYAIAVVNNADKKNSKNQTVGFHNTYYANDSTLHVLSRYDYKLKVLGGEAHPVFERTNPQDPASSYLVGFTIVSTDIKGLTPAVNGVKVASTGKKTAEGLEIYDLSAYKSSRTDASDDATITSITFIDERPPVVSTDDSFTPDDAYVKVSSVSAAINTLGEEGGTIYIKGNYSVSSMATEFAGTENIADGKKITITGYTADGSNGTDNTLTLGGNFRTAWLYSDLEFNNISLASSLGTANSSHHDKGFNSNGNTLTFGDNLNADFVLGVVGNAVNGVANNIVINSGTYKGLATYQGPAATMFGAGTSVNYIINGGSFTDATAQRIYVGFNSNAWLKEGTTAIKDTAGNTIGINVGLPYVNYVINGGDFNSNYIRTSGATPTGTTHAKFTATGLMLLDIRKATNLKEIELYPALENVVDGNATDGYTVTIKAVPSNIAIILDAKNVATKVTSYLGSNYSIKNTDANNGKKYVICVNNYESGSYVSNYKNDIDYVLLTKGGVTKPVFEETTLGDATTCTLKGFTIVPNAENEGKVAVIGDVVLTPDANGVYNLSTVAEDKGTVTIEFIEKEQEVDYSSFSTLRNDFNNSLAKLNKANETVNVVYFGGSITAGTGSTAPSTYSWRARTNAWLESTYPATINAVNAAMPGTNTTLGIYRLINNVIKNNPDILFIEFTLNDLYDNVSIAQSKSQFETIIREVKRNAPNCDIALVVTTDRGKVMDAKQGKLHEHAVAHDMIAEQYGVSTIYVGKALASHFEDGLTGDALVEAWANYSGDYTHPNDDGYEIYFKTVRDFFKNIYSGDYVAADKKNIDVTDASTFISDYLADGNRTLVGFDGTYVVESSEMLPEFDSDYTLKDLEKTGFQEVNETIIFDSGDNRYNGYLSLPVGTNGTLTYTFDGTEFMIFSKIPLGSTIYCTLDGGEEQAITVSRRSDPLFTDLTPGTHTVTIRIDWANINSTTAINLFAVGSRDASIATGFIRTENITELDSYKNGAVPAKNGYLFAGWYESETAEKAMNADEFAAAETAVAKFIPKAVLDIKWQLGKGENGTANLRLISTVDSLQYQKVIFNVSVVGRETPFDPLESTTVYTGISGYVDGNEQNYAPTINSISSNYFMTHIITGIPVEFHDNEFTVSASVVTKDGQIITGDEFTFTLKSATDYDKVMGN